MDFFGIWTILGGLEGWWTLVLGRVSGGCGFRGRLWGGLGGLEWGGAKGEPSQPGPPLVLAVARMDRPAEEVREVRPPSKHGFVQKALSKRKVVLLRG